MDVAPEIRMIGAGNFLAGAAATPETVRHPSELADAGRYSFPQPPIPD